MAPTHYQEVTWVWTQNGTVGGYYDKWNVLMLALKEDRCFPLVGWLYYVVAVRVSFRWKLCRSVWWKKIVSYLCSSCRSTYFSREFLASFSSLYKIPLGKFSVRNLAENSWGDTFGLADRGQWMAHRRQWTLVVHGSSATSRVGAETGVCWSCCDAWASSFCYQILLQYNSFAFQLSMLQEKFFSSHVIRCWHSVSAGYQILSQSIFDKFRLTLFFVMKRAGCKGYH